MRLDAAPPESHVNSGRARAGRDSGAPRVDFRGDPARWITLAERFGLLVAAGGHGSRGCYRRARTARRSAWPPASAPSTTSAPRRLPAAGHPRPARPLGAGCFLDTQDHCEHVQPGVERVIRIVRQPRRRPEMRAACPSGRPLSLWSPIRIRCGRCAGMPGAGGGGHTERWPGSTLASAGSQGKAGSDRLAAKGRRAVAVLTARGIGKSFGRHRVLAGLDLQVAAGEMVAVAGENGSGKSTLLRILAGDLRPEFPGRLRDRRAGPGGGAD